VSCRVVGTRVHPQGRGDVESCRCHRCCRCCRCSPSRQPSLAAHHSETNVRRRISAFLRSKKLQYIPIGSEYSETADPPKLANSASIVYLYSCTDLSLPPPLKTTRFGTDKDADLQPGAAVPAPRRGLLKSSGALPICRLNFYGRGRPSPFWRPVSGTEQTKVPTAPDAC
jgi:hypothetical protein